MYLLLIRHGEAEAKPGQADEERRLTTNGIRTVRAVAKGLRYFLPQIDLIIASPLSRAEETARIIEAEFKALRTETVQWLRSETWPEDTLRELAHETGDCEYCCLVGHEPNLSGVLSLMLAESGRNFIQMGKGTAALVGFEGRPQAGKGVLIFHLPSALFGTVSEA